MSGTKISSFEDINNIFYRIFGFSGLDLFMKKGPKVDHRNFKTMFVGVFLVGILPVHISLHVSSFFTKGINLQTVLINLSIILNAGDGVIKTIYFLVFRDRMESLCIKFDRFKSTKTDLNVSLKMLSDKTLWLSKLVRNGLIMTFFVLFCWAYFPIIQSDTVKSWLNINSSLSSNVSIQGPPKKFLPCYYPFDSDYSPMFEIIYVFEFFSALSGLTYMMAFDFFIITVCEMYCAHINVFNRAILNKINNKGFTIKDVINEHVYILK